jgi:outer membrane protein OmpA-like peptidoglycan-associated protein
MAIVRFPLSSSALTPHEADAVQQLAPALRSLIEKSQLLRRSVSIDIVGHSDSTGAEATNQPLSQSRADRVLAQLTRDGVPETALHSRGVAASEPLRKEENEEARQYNRSVTFRVNDASPAAVGRTSSNKPASTPAGNAVTP